MQRCTLVALKLAIVLVTILSQPDPTLAAEQMHHPKHNLVVFGETQVFASHIVFKQPHNYQVELALTFSADVQDAYLRARTGHPDDTYIFLLDPVDISQVSNLERLTGALFRRDHNNQRFDIASSVVVERDSFQVIFLQELPLSLSSNP